MKTLSLFVVALIAVIGLSFTHSVGSEVCGVIKLGKYQISLSEGNRNIEIPKDKLVESIKSGFVFTGTSKCPGTYELIDVSLTIEAAKGVTYQYDQGMIRQFPAMEFYMLVRYFNDAQTLSFHSIKVKDQKGNVLDLPAVSVVVK